TAEGARMPGDVTRRRTPSADGRGEPVGMFVGTARKRRTAGMAFGALGRYGAHPDPVAVPRPVSGPEQQSASGMSPCRSGNPGSQPFDRSMGLTVSGRRGKLAMANS